ncbi:MAG: alkaline phosphatase family protein [Verrucomicrobia bacterium]|nr:alkaline phosphatase family protein [Verrucomicrobiota bacterium]
MIARTAVRFPSFVFILVLFLATSPIFGQQAAPRNAAPSDKHVVIISIDGMRPDVLLRAKAPNIRELTQRGSFTFWAESTDVAITLPTHVSMLTGVSPTKHKVLWNDDREVEPSMLAVPTIFDLTKKAGYSNAMVVGKRKLTIMAKPGMVDWVSAPEKKVKTDALKVAALAVQVLRQHRPSVLFVHFPDPDAVGHAIGWGTSDQVAVADRADQGVGIIAAALRELHLQEKTLFIVTADHGGSGRSHGAKVPFSHYIPWIAVGPGVRENYDLTLEPKLSVHVVDVFATALNFLGVAVPADADGQPVLAIYGKAQNAELKPKR